VYAFKERIGLIHELEGRLVWERMVSMLSMTFEACVPEEEDTRSMLSLRLRLQQLLWGRKYVRFCVRAEPMVTPDCLGPRTNSGVPERSILLGIPRSVAVLIGSGIVLVLLAWVGSFEGGACVSLEADR
jgi:hypothetical protein